MPLERQKTGKDQTRHYAHSRSKTIAKWRDQFRRKTKVEMNTFVLEKSIGKDPISHLKLGFFYSTEHWTQAHSGYTLWPDFKPKVTSQLHNEQKSSPGNLLTWPLQRACCMARKHQVMGFLSRWAYPSWGPAGAPHCGIQLFIAPLSIAFPYQAAK